MATTTTTQTTSEEPVKLVLNVPRIDIKGRLAKDGESILLNAAVAMC